MQFVRKIWRQGRAGKALIGCGGLFAALCLCSAIATVFSPGGGKITPTPLATVLGVSTAEATHTSAPTQAATATEVPLPMDTATATVAPLPTDTATVAPTATAVPTAVPTDKPETTSTATDTPMPEVTATDTPEPVVVATDTSAPVVEQSADAATAEQPTQAPVAEEPPQPPAQSVCSQGCTEIQPGCEIIGNVNSKGERIYHLPGWRDYGKIKFRPEEGDRYFCTTDEAVQNGFRPAQQ